MPVYRKKPVEIQAMHCATLITFASGAWDKLPQWFVEAYNRGEVAIASDHIGIQTLEGIMTAHADKDMVICGVKGELYPCKLEIFAETYDHVRD